MIDTHVSRIAPGVPAPKPAALAAIARSVEATPPVTFDHVARDGARIYHDRQRCIAAVVGPPQVIIERYSHGWRDFDLYAVPHDLALVLVRFDVALNAVARAAALVGSGPWQRLQARDLAVVAAAR